MVYSDERGRSALQLVKLLMSDKGAALIRVHKYLKQQSGMYASSYGNAGTTLTVVSGFTHKIK